MSSSNKAVGKGAAGTAAHNVSVNYDVEKENISRFLTKYVVTTPDAETNAPTRRHKYTDMFEEVAAGISSSITIDLDDIVNFENSDEDLTHNIEVNTKSYQKLFYQVIDGLLPPSSAHIDSDSSTVDVILHQRRQRDLLRGDDATDTFSPDLTRRYSLYFKPRSKAKTVSIRDIKGAALGHLVTVKGIVTRVSNVKPLAVVTALSCDRCGHEIFQEVTSQTFTPLAECPTEDCKKNGSKGKLQMQTRASKFVRFQEIKIQELTEQVPMGHIPRYMSVHLTEDLTRQVTPGDTVYITGIYLPSRFTGFKAIRSGLYTDTYLEAQHIDQLKKQYNQMEVTPAVAQKIQELIDSPDLYGLLASSIAPEIYGHEDVKKALLLLLVGGATKETADGMKIRGDLNICLMGDPGVAKSQLLKFITKIAPRGVYTTGRGSSGVGLTASVMRDPVTDEMVLEGGALVLADNGIACIDEFDKMDENDRTAIHEVMEQQTISISKAGITTTLNARTSILAAANPVGGRYNTHKKATENINLPAALLSRFDLLFLILDRPSLDLDVKLAEHVTYVHMNNVHPPLDRENDIQPVDAEVMRHYIALARTYSPKLKPETAGFLVNAYTHTRQREDLSELQYTCARTLLSMIRLATALARLRFSDEVEVGDVEEALRLIDVSKSSVNQREANQREDPTSAIYRIIKDMSREGHSKGEMSESLNMEDIRFRITNKGHSDEQLQACIDFYEANNLWMRTNNGNMLTWINDND
ncbi:Mcm2-7 hexameric complex component, partial [Chytridiales sp. JEL 0842]